jgi:hypothetical protein
MTGSAEDLGKSRRPSTKDQGWSSTGQVLGGRTIGSSGDTVCDLYDVPMCGLYHVQGDEEHVFLG